MECIASVLDWLAQHAPIVTALVAVTAVWVAWHSLKTQRDTARKRAALDLFFKTEMDKSIATAFEDYDDHINVLHANKDMPMKEFAEEKHKKEYRNIVSCLNIHELVAVGVYTCVLDEEVCYQFWADELRHAHRDAIRVIEYMRTEGGGTPYTYTELVKLANEWDQRVRDVEAGKRPG